jgi:hypothetical protein
MRLVDVLSFDCFFFLFHNVFLFESPSSPQIGSVIKHVIGIWIQCPVATLARLLIIPRDFHEAFIEAKVMSYTILPALFVLSIVWKAFHDELIDSIECTTFVWCILNGHCYECNVTVRWFNHVLPCHHLLRIGTTGVSAISGIMFIVAWWNLIGGIDGIAGVVMSWVMSVVSTMLISE